MLNRQKEAALWQAKYDTMFADYHAAANRCLKTDSAATGLCPYIWLTLHRYSAVNGLSAMPFSRGKFSVRMIPDAGYYEYA